MTRSGSGKTGLTSDSLAFLLSWASVGLLAIYLSTVLPALLPTELLNPSWQLRVSSVLINNGPIALLGFLLMPLAAWIDPGSQRIARWTTRVQRLGLVAVLGFLLLLPLQAAAIVQGLHSANQSAIQARELSQRRISDVRREVLAATSTADLQQRLRRIRGLPLDLSRLQDPLPQLRQRFLVAIQILEGRLRNQPSGPDPRQVWQVIKEAVSSSVSAIVLSLAFAAGSKRSRASRSLLAEIPAGWEAQALRWRRWRERSRREGDLRRRTRRAEAAAEKARQERQASGSSSLFEDDD
ncbi:MAG: hypothetical protein VKK62_05075 [Synechococcaceae cyanobacterium]|nr:hypothetical protein [Synechococcaceae cyanobacterium]